MAWDSSRPVPWRRLGMWMGIYIVVMFAVSMFSGKSTIGGTMAAVISGSLIAGLIGFTLIKFGWKIPMLMSREEAAAHRAEAVARRQAYRAAKKGQPVQAAADGPRARPAPTRRTTTGPSQHPRRTTKTRKR